MEKPNLLLIMTDQQRWDAMGCSGGWVDTPNMDRIAADGVRFSNCVTNSPVCIPARLSLATGLYPHNTGVWQNMGHTLSPNANTWMQAVRNAGYRTSLFGKTHLHPHGGDLRDREHLMHAYGLDDVNEIGGPRASARCMSHMTERWQQKGKWTGYQEDFDERFSNKPYVVRPSTLDLEDYADVYVGQQAKTYLQNYERDQPWFCWVSFGGPHEPWDTPEPYASRYNPDDMPDPVLAPKEDRERPRGLLDKRLEKGQIDFEPGEEKRLRADYAGNITLIDDQIGEILGVLEVRGELDNTVIVLVSDHGEMNGDYGFIYKEHLLNGSVRVPLLVRTPNTIGSEGAGTVCDSPVEWMDVGPTLVELAGGALNYQQFGKSVCPTLGNLEVEHRTEAISEYGGEVMLLNREWKAVLNREGEVYLLFNVEDDPEEVHNLAGLADFSEIEHSIRLR
ncbi:MAG: sulfatase-like hydrolase/transferase, partial [Candidatus Latescibacteria bacterium]|nr:sulfatase-like hydrolase/transferase [Candidatus Latescibacterota bacterium]